MKIIKIIVINIFISFCVFLILRNSKTINLEGNWNATKIVVDKEDLLISDSINKFFDIGNQIMISHSGHSISISVGEHKLIAGFIIEDQGRDKNHITLSSQVNALNGNFDMKIDTVHLGPQAYRVEVKLDQNKTHIYFQREVIIPPWNPPFPKRGDLNKIKYQIFNILDVSQQAYTILSLIAQIYNDSAEILSVPTKYINLSKN